MSGSVRGRSWGVPWLGLPLSGVLALTGAAHTLVSLPDPAEFGRLPAAEVAATTDQPPPRLADRAGELQRGQSLSALLLALGLTPEEAHAAAVACGRHVDLRQLRSGTHWRGYLGADGGLERFELVLAERGELLLDRSPAGWSPSFQPFRRELRRRAIRGHLVGSLEASVARAGAPASLAYAMADVLQWDLDFTRDLRRDDEFRVVFEEVLVDGYEPRPDRIVAVSYARKGGRTVEAFAFGEGEQRGYYDAEGRPLQKLFLRSPLPYSRVTSGFTHRRFHPVLGVFRPHHGVDYGAPVGTPVRVTAAGTVVSAGWDGGGGKTVKVRHPNGYLTAYLHLSRFADGVRSGTQVRQGEVIGFVGATGLASGPHLDYRVQLHGRWIDPLSIKAVPAEPISPLHRAQFAASRDALRRGLATGQVEPAGDGDRLAAGGAPAADGPGGRAGRRR